MAISILNRYTKAVLYTSATTEDIVTAVIEAIKSGANLIGADLSRANLIGADLSGANLRWANLSRANLSRANLSGANLSEADLSRTNLSGANLSEADLRWANLSRANLRWANLSEANLSRTNLSEADLSGANLSRANLSEADLSGANLSRTNLSEADLSGAKGLLPNGLVPLQILATRDAIVVRTSGFITIGCEHHDIAWWRENCQKLGERERYNPQQIVEYRAHINYCAQWMKTYGVDQVSRCEACSGTGFTVNSGGGKEPCQCKTKDIEDAGLCQWGYQPDSLTLVLQEVGTRRASQDANHGGPEHDDTHTPADWRAFIGIYNQRAEEYESEPEIRESKLKDVAALAVAAIQSSRRKRA
jgi:hypothetical protein